jgi:lysophospholipase L1-like esterase
VESGGSTGRGGAGGSASGGATASPNGGSTGSAGSGVGGAVETNGGASGSKGGQIGGANTQGGSSAGSGGNSSGGVSGSGGTSETGGSKDAGASGGATAGGATGAGGSTGTQHWVGTWTASPYYDSANQPPTSLASSVLRQIAHVSLGGSQIRVQFSNLSGNGSVTLKSAHLALCKATPAVDSTIDTATDKALAFSGTASVTIAQGKEVWSDPIDFPVPSQGNVSITVAFGSVPSNVVGHSGSRTTSFLQANSSNVSAASMASATATEHWYYLSGIDVMADASAKGIVAIGDSITDGRGTDTNKNNRWTDILAARLQANAATGNVSMMNQGIGATNLVGSSGTAAQARFDRDVLGSSGVRYAIVFDGVNDIGGGASFASMKAAYDDLIGRAHAKGLLIYGATILPFAGNSYYTTAHESVRQQVNAYIKSGVFDGTIDFDAALTDSGNPPKLQATYATWAQTDWLHPGPSGYQKMGDSVDLALFTK